MGPDRSQHGWGRDVEAGVYQTGVCALRELYKTPVCAVRKTYQTGVTGR